MERSPRDGVESDEDEEVPEVGEEEKAFQDADKSGIYVVKEVTENFVIYRWKVENLSTLPDRLYSPEFSMGTNKWRFLLFPKGNMQNKDISVYLDCPDAPTERVGWTRYAEFRLGAVNQKYLERSRFQEARKRFNRSEPDWGFRNFLALAKAEDPEAGFVVNDTLIIEARIEVKKDQFSGYAYYGFDCRKETGYVGLLNQGATCYMNSLLQTLYHIPHFRRCVFDMKIGVEDPEFDPSKSIPLAMQRLFWQLQFSGDAVSTKKLTKSFGWGSDEAFVQHDVQELLRVLIDNLDEKMKGTELEGNISKMFGGVIKNYIECVNVEFESSREEPYFDLQLVVKNCKNLMESFNKYVEFEMLDGENKYDAEGFGKQDAKRGAKFMTLPPILMLHLKRFEYDWERDHAYKINDRYEFPVDTNLDAFLAPEAERGDTNDYTLLSILVHSGDVGGGHYYAYIRPCCEDKWFKFDDDRVTPSTEKEAVEDNFGGEEEPAFEKPVKNTGYPNWDVPVGHVSRFQSIFKRYANAYMLVYVRRAEMNLYMQPIEVEDIDESLRIQFEKEEEEEKARRKAKSEAYLFTTVKVLSEKALLGRKGFDLVDEEMLKSEDIKVKVKKTDLATDMLAAISSSTGIDAEKLRLWKFETRQNYVSRPQSILTKFGEHDTVEKCLGIRSYYLSSDKAILIAQEVPSAAENKPGVSDFFLIIKFFDPETKGLSIVDMCVRPSHTTVAELARDVAVKMGLPEETPLEAFEETKASMREMDLERNLREENITSGDILTFQKANPGPGNSVVDYFNYMINRVTVKFALLEEPSEIKFELDLMKNMTYVDVVNAIGEKIGHHPENIRLTSHSTYLDAPRQTSIRSSDARTLRDMLFYANSWSDKLYFEPLEESVAEMETKKEINLRFFDSNAQEVSKLKLVVPKKATISFLLSEVASKLKLEGTPLRLIETFNGKVQKKFKDTESVDWLHEYGHIILRVEEIPADQLPNALGPHDRIVQVQHFCKEHSISIRCFGHPLLLRVTPEETFGELKARVKAIILNQGGDPAVTEEEFEKWKFAVLYFQKPTYITDEMVVLKELERVETYRIDATIGMEHKDLAAKESSTSSYSYLSRRMDAPLKINN